MASSVLTGNSLILKYKTGTNDKGEDVFSSQKYSNTNIAITDDDLYAVATSIKSLMASPVIYVSKQSDYVIEA